MTKEMEGIVFSYPKLRERIEERPSEVKRAKKLLKEMASTYKESTVQYLKVFLENTLLKLYDGVNFDTQELGDLKEYMKKYHVVLVPNHQSHADYLVLNYALYNTFRVSAHIAGGINLNVFPIGPIFRSSGCFFIRRSFNSDILYKLLLEAYIYYLLKTNRIIEFFFEGGRSRTGKVLNPKYGLFQTILQAHSMMKDARPLCFVPISIMHEHVPEQKSLALELVGKEKKKESFQDVLKLYRMLSKNFGTVHLKVAKPIIYDQLASDENLKDMTYEVAMRCHEEVGRRMLITPSSILALILLDEPTGTLTLEFIVNKAKHMLAYCETFGIPYSPSLKLSSMEDTLYQALELFYTSGKVKKIFKNKLDKLFYSIYPNSRMEMVYFKNSILHHFLIPFFVNTSLIQVEYGAVKNEDELRAFLKNQALQLSREFILPPAKILYQKGLLICSQVVGKEIHSLEDCLQLSGQDKEKLILKLGSFANSFRYIYEAHYLAALTLNSLGKRYFSLDIFKKVGKEIFEIELEHGKIVKFPESFNFSNLRSSFDYFRDQDIIKKSDKGEFHVDSSLRLKNVIEENAKNLTQLLVYNLKVSSSLIDGI